MPHKSQLRRPQLSARRSRDRALASPGARFDGWRCSSDPSAGGRMGNVAKERHLLEVAGRGVLGWAFGANQGDIARFGRLPGSIQLVLALFEGGAELGVVGFELEDGGDAGEVEPGVEKVADATEPVEVVGAVEAGAAVGAGGLEKSAAFVESQALRVQPDEFRGD